MSRRPHRDPMSVVERAYDLTETEDRWVAGLVEAAAPLLDEGTGVWGCVVDLSAPRPQRSPASVGGTEEWQRTWREGWWEQVVLAMPHDAVAHSTGFGPVAYASHVGAALARQIDTFEQFVESLGSKGIPGSFGRTVEVTAPRAFASYPESLAIVARDSTGHAVGIFANRAENATRPPTRITVRTWSRVAAHIVAAHRMRRRLGASPFDGAEAVITPRGRVVHAEGPASTPANLELLRNTAIGIDRARTARVRSTGEALELWRAVHEGRWSIADTFDHDGRRFLVVRENEPAADPAPALSRREQQVLDLLALGHSNTTIAYQLGLSTSSVATHIRRAAAKLNLPDTRELVRWARARRRPTDGT